MTLPELITEINQRFAFIESLGVIYDMKERRQITNYAFALSCANKQCENTKPVHELWRKSPDRRTFKAIAYHPSPACPKDVFNTHYGMAVSKRGSVALWTRLMDSLYVKDTPERRFAELWDGYPIAHPGAKLATARLVWSPEKGVGKGAEATALSYIYGSHNCSLSVNDQQLGSKFNDWMEDKQLVVVPEANLNKKTLTERMKDYITNPSAHFERKYCQGYDGATCVNYLLHSNNADAIRIANRDRRYHVHQVVGRGLKDDAAFWNEFFAWARENPGALRYHFEHLDYSGFNPFAPAPETEAKLSMMDDTGTEEEIFIARLRNNPEEVLGPGVRLFTTNALICKYGKKTNAHRWPGMLREAGTQKIVPTDVEGIDGRNQIKIGGKMQTVWTSEPGLKLTAKAIREEYRPLTEQERIQGGNHWDTGRLARDKSNAAHSAASWKALIKEKS
jgi:hypothetical protein